jgi:serralysin
MSLPTASSPTTDIANSGTRYIDALLDGEKWGGGLGQGSVISYSFPWTTSSTAVFRGPGGFGSYSDLDEPNAARHYGLDAVERTAARDALQSWANVARLTPLELNESGSSVGDIRIAWTSASETTSSGEPAWGWGNFPGSYYPVSGDIWINTTATDNSGTDWSSGRYNYMSLVHELGHALGLKHPFGSGVVLDAAHDNRQYSLMSYSDAPNSLYVEVVRGGPGNSTWTSRHVQPDGPMLYDIAAMQYLYGANTAYHAGNDVYTFDPGQPLLHTIWDGGGVDTISIANFSTDCVIDLQQGHFSSLRFVFDTGSDLNWETEPPPSRYVGDNDLAIAYNCVIENATGGGGNDILIGNSAGNRLTGGGGSNTLDGGGGIDTAVYGGNYGDYTLRGGASAYQLSGRGGVDSLSNVERLQFADVTLALGAAALDADPLRAGYVAMAQKFYVAYFGRPADVDGLGSMVSRLVAAHAPVDTTDSFIAAYDSNATVKAIVDSFGNSAESAALYHGNSRDFITTIYSHVLGRAPDAEGLNYWAGALDRGLLVRGRAALDILAGAETNSTVQGVLDGALVANRIAVAGNFTNAIDSVAEQMAYVGNNAAAAARALLDQVFQASSVFDFEGKVLATLADLIDGHQSQLAPVELVGQAHWDHLTA